MITGTHVNYYHICHRKLWLFVNGIQMEHTSDLVYEGKMIHEQSYPQRAHKYTEIALDGIKIDFYDPHNKVVHEIKKSESMEQAHVAQVKYYLYVLEENGITNATGILEYPKIRHTQKIELNEDDRIQIKQIRTAITSLIYSSVCPPTITKRICTKCSYHDFCWSAE